MALDLNQISAITRKKIIPKLTDNIFQASPILQRLKNTDNMKTQDGGTEVVLPLEYAMISSSDWYTGSETMQTTDNETVTGATFYWKQAYANITIVGLDKLKNSGDSAVIDHVKTKSKNAEKTLQDKIGTGIYSAGTNAKSIIGFRVFLSASNTYGGISQTNYSWWRPSGLDTTTTTLTLTAMQACFNSATYGNDSPTIIPTTRTLYNSYWALLQPQQRFTDSKSANAGWSSILFNGVPVIVDSYCPTGYMNFLNEKYLYFVTHSDRNFKMTDFQTPHNQDVETAKVLWAGIFGCSALRNQSGMTALTA